MACDERRLDQRVAVGVVGVGVRQALAQPGGEPEAAADAGGAAGAGLAAHQLGELAGDGQPEPGAAVLAGGRAVHLLEGRKQPRQLLGGDADAGVFDLEVDPHAVERFVLGPDADAHAAVLGELDGVAGEVEQGLLEAQRVALQMGRDGRQRGD